jgi:16S rRNA (adenine1518-N6/adenine1519-N6)-dimethyltransferase
MKISNPKELKRFLDEHGLAAKKSASQNFLIDGNIVRKIVSEAHLSSEDVVVEIGPGPGALTEELLETGCSVIAIEKDQELGSLLNRFATSEKRLSVYVEDFLRFDLRDLLKKKLAPGKKAKVVANLPYHITTPILEKLLPLHDCISDLVLMVQKEVAVRFVAPVGTKDYSSFTVFLQFFSKVSYCFTIEPGCFSPKPTVQSAVVHLTLTPPPGVKSLEGFFQMTRTAFGKRRKMMRSSLKDLFPPKTIEASLEKMNLNPQIRPEELSLAQFIELYGILSNDSGPLQ